MTRQLNVRVSDIDYLLFETMQDILKENGVNLNQRELIEKMILKTYTDMNQAQHEGKELTSIWQTK